MNGIILHSVSQEDEYNGSLEHGRREEQQKHQLMQGSKIKPPSSPGIHSTSISVIPRNSDFL